MITESQIKVLTEDELSYLVYCLKSEWDSLNMKYDFKFDFIKSFRNDSIHYILNKHSSKLKDEHKNIIMDILNKLEANV